MCLRHVAVSTCVCHHIAVGILVDSAALLSVKCNVYRVHNVKAYWVVEEYIHSFLTSAMYGVEGQLYAPAVLLMRKATPAGGGVGPIAAIFTVRAVIQGVCLSVVFSACSGHHWSENTGSSLKCW
jgi:hypothetical protein